MNIGAMPGRSLLMVACVSVAVACSGGTSADTEGEGVKASAPAQPAASGPVVAEVGIGYVTEEDFSDAAARSPGAAPDMSLDKRKEILDTLVTEEAMFQEALQVGLVRDPKVRKVLVNLLLRREVYAKVGNSDFTDDQLRSYYNEHKSDFVVPAKVQVKRILVAIGEERTKEEAEAMLSKARTQLKKDPGKFSELASSMSEDAYRRRGGDLGFLPRDGKPGIDPKVAEVAFDLKSGQLSELFEADGGLNLVMAVTRRDQVERTFEQMRGSVLRKLRNERFQELTEQYVDGLVTKSGVKIDEERLGAAAIQARRGDAPGLELDDGHGHGGAPHGGPPKKGQLPKGTKGKKPVRPQ